VDMSGRITIRQIQENDPQYEVRYGSNWKIGKVIKEKWKKLTI
jgi:hypothetical protein